MIKQIYKFLNPKFQNLFLEYKVEFKPRYGYGKPAHQDLYRIIDKNRDKYKKLIQKALLLKESIWTIKDLSKETDSIKPTWNNGFFYQDWILLEFTHCWQNLIQKSTSR